MKRNRNQPLFSVVKSFVKMFTSPHAMQAKTFGFQKTSDSLKVQLDNFLGIAQRELASSIYFSGSVNALPGFISYKFIPYCFVLFDRFLVKNIFRLKFAR